MGGKDVQEKGTCQKFQKIGEKESKVRPLILGCKGKYLGHKIGKQNLPLARQGLGREEVSICAQKLGKCTPLVRQGCLISKEGAAWAFKVSLGF